MRLQGGTEEETRGDRPTPSSSTVSPVTPTCLPYNRDSPPGHPCLPFERTLHACRREIVFADGTSIFTLRSRSAEERIAIAKERVRQRLNQASRRRPSADLSPQ